MFENLYPVILCGGSGTRLWPLSRTALPKQFIDLTKQTLFEETLDRIYSFTDKSVVVCGNEHRFLVANMMLEKKLNLTKNAILLEPMAKNTALAISLSAFHLLEKNKDAVLFVLPSDHILEPVEVLKEKIANSFSYTENHIVTFGIKPDTPHTGYGYIERAEELTPDLFKVKCFTEKPNAEKAESLIESGASWNSGMFLMRADLYLEELKKYRKDIYEAALAVWNSHYSDLDFTRFNEEIFAASPAESIDYAVMEQTDKALVCPLDINWSDLGSFQALYEESKRDDNNNALVGDVITSETTNSYIHASSALVAVHGMDNVVVVQTKDAVLVSSLDKTQDIKSFINLMKDRQRTELDFHCVYHRPWGFYESLINSDRFQVKHITVNPGGVLSVQKHHHRSEHWIVVKGTATVRCGDIEKLLTENESIYIPLGEIHRLSNPGNIPLELIEVQTGSYLGEDDIVRLEDAYGR